MKNNKTIGVSFILVGLLNFTRMIPFYAGNEAADSLPDFPLSTALDIVTFVSSNINGHIYSHVMALISFPLLFIGIIYLYDSFKEKAPIASKVLITSGIFGVFLFTIAVITDGFIMSYTVEQYLAAGTDVLAISSLVETTHHGAVQFFAIALFCLMIFVLTTSVIVRHKQKTIGNWIGWVGLVIGAIGVLGYISGVFGYNWENFPLSGMSIMLMYLWYILFGVALLLVKNESEN